MLQQKNELVTMMKDDLNILAEKEDDVIDRSGENIQVTSEKVRLLS